MTNSKGAAEMIKKCFIILGNKCNFKCKYCFDSNANEQGGIHPFNEVESNKTLDKIVACAKAHNERTDEPFIVDFGGGEPLCYYTVIEDLMRQLKDRANFTFTITTNGDWLNRRIVRSLNDYGVNVVVSNEGMYTTLFRPKNVLENFTTRNLIMNIKKLSMSCVICSGSEHFLQVIDYWDDKLERKVPYYFYPLKQTEKVAPELYKYFDHGAMYDNLKVLVSNAFEYAEFSAQSGTMSWQALLGTKDVRAYNFLQQYLKVYAKLKFKDEACMNDVYVGKTRCGIVDDVLTLDLSGNVYACHAIQHKIGYRDTEEQVLMSNLGELADKNINACKDCDILEFCRGGCVLADKYNKKFRQDDIYCLFMHSLATQFEIAFYMLQGGVKENV